MAHKFNSVFRNQGLGFAQKGAVLIFLAFVLGLGAAAYMLKALNASSLQAKQNEKTYEALGEAKQALLAWAVSHQYSPGQMPWPDRKEAVSPNYDGSSDCVTTAFQSSYLLGQLPSLPTTSPCLDPNAGLFVYAGLSTYPSLGQEFRDAQGNRLWYAVSRNLVYDYENSENPIINPGMINAPHAITPYMRQGGTQSYPWLQVLDRNGSLISDRVAVVLIAPGDPVGGQNRSGVANPDQFLDSFRIGAANYKNSDSALADEDFIMGEDSRNVSANDPTFVQPYNFNDKLVYITIDELMVALEKRAANDIENALLNYFEPASVSRPNGRGIGYFPYAARLGSNKDYACITSNNAGVLPIGTVAPTNFTCNYSRAGSPRVTSVSCTTGFSNLNSIQFQRNTNNFTASSGACSFNGRVCTCTGAGSCSRVAAQTQAFSCDAAGNCLTSANTGSLNGTITFSGGEFTTTIPIALPPPSPSPPCNLSCVDAVCSGDGLATASRTTACGDTVFNAGSSSLPAWIMVNKWYDYFYYANSETGRGAIVVEPLTIGARLNIDAMLIGTGRPIIAPNIALSKGANQIRSSCSLNDHLDSLENTNAGLVFDAITLTRTQNYNDHSYIVAP